MAVAIADPPASGLLGLPHGEQLNACIRCGLCLSVCPTYREEGIETQSPRGRVNLIKAVDEGVLHPTETFRAHMYHCLDCRACESVCPPGLKIGELIVEARGAIERRRPQPLLKRFILRWLLTRPSRYELFVWPMRLYQRSGLRWLLRASGLLPRISPYLATLEALLPDLPPRPLRQEVPVISPAFGEERFRVGFFLGCVMSVVFADASRATMKVLRRNSCSVVTPKDQYCCGAPHISEGEFDTARDLARHNIDVFESLNVDYVVCDCAACGAETKGYQHLLKDDPEYAERARAFSAKVRDISEFLVDVVQIDGGLAALEGQVTYHDACHLCHAQGIKRQPRAVVKSIPGIQYKELPEADWCCGSAGDYVLTHQERALKILERKMANVNSTDADLLVAGNPGCMLQLNLGVQRTGSKARVVHLSQLVEAAYEAGERQGAPNGGGPAR